MISYSTGLELILNACEGVLQIGITDDEKPLCFEEWHQPQGATEILVPALQEICSRLHINITFFRRIACVTGPGSFTGIRLVLTTAAAFRRASKAQLASLNYLQALATSAAMRCMLLYSEKIFVITHARHNLLHFQEFICYGAAIPALPQEEVALISPKQAIKRIGDEKCIICGSGLNKNADIFDQPVTGKGPLGAPNAFLLPNLTSPDFAALRLLARHGDYFPRDLEPHYVRECDAVENLPKQAEKEGKNPEDQIRVLRQLLNQKTE